MLTIYFVLAIVALALLALIFWLYYKKTERLTRELTQRLADSEQQLTIAEENFFTRKMNQKVFEKILHDYKEQMLEIELQIIKLRGNLKVDVQERLKSLGARIKNPTKAQIHRLEKLLTEAESLVKEINFLHNKLLKHEIDEELFNHLSEEKQKRIISAEAKIRKMTKPPAPTAQKDQEQKTEPEQEAP